MALRKICVVTGTRADYGLLYWVMKEIDQDQDLKLQIIVTGMHLSPEFGLTYRIIEQDGFLIDEKVEMLMSSDTPVGIAKSIGLGVIGFADALERLKPDIMVVLGDRFEILAAVQAAMAARIPIAHIHGGESTEGLIDEAIRHAVTKMSHVHFVATETYRNRVIQMGEDPEKVINTGAPGLDHIKRMKLLTREELEQSIKFKFGKVNFLVTYHPVTLKEKSSEKAIKELLKALDHFPDAKVIITKSNADTDGRIISKIIDNYANIRKERVYVTTSLGQLKYLSAVKHVDVVIGNSSSGIIEVPFLKKPTVNIGDRQRGRLKPPSVIDCTEDEKEIVLSIKKAISPDYLQSLKSFHSLYGDGNASTKIKDYLKTVDLKNIIFKKFFEIGDFS